MPDFVLFAQALLLSAAISGAITWFANRSSSPRWRQFGEVVGLAAGIYAGCGLIGDFPEWLPREDRSRFLTVLLPLALLVEGAAACGVSTRTKWLLRVTLAFVAVPVLLYQTSYVADLKGPGSAEWTLIQSAGIFLCLAILLLTNWALLARVPTAALRPAELPALLALVCLASGFTVMLSGYYRGGLLAIPLAGSLVGVAVALWRTTETPADRPSVGIGLVLIFSILVIGRFFGSLPTLTALGLGLAPQLIWLVEHPALRAYSSRMRHVLVWVFIAAALVSIVVAARVKFERDFAAPTGRYAPSH